VFGSSLLMRVAIQCPHNPFGVGALLKSLKNSSLMLYIDSFIGAYLSSDNENIPCSGCDPVRNAVFWYQTTWIKYIGDDMMDQLIKSTTWK
jgi:hypothetical protein